MARSIFSKAVGLGTATSAVVVGLGVGLAAGGISESNWGELSSCLAGSAPTGGRTIRSCQANRGWA